jgi:hypothetical protein
MKCPKCGGEYHCGCASCSARNTDGKVLSKPDGDYDTCGHCGHRMHDDMWLDESFRQLRKKRKAAP